MRKAGRREPGRVIETRGQEPDIEEGTRVSKVGSAPAATKSRTSAPTLADKIERQVPRTNDREVGLLDGHSHGK